MDPKSLGTMIGAALGRAVEAMGLGDRIRASYAAKYGSCRRCDAPLGGSSPERVCETCHADEALATAHGNDAIDA